MTPVNSHGRLAGERLSLVSVVLLGRLLVLLNLHSLFSPLGCKVSCPENPVNKRETKIGIKSTLFVLMSFTVKVLKVVRIYLLSVNLKFYNYLFNLRAPAQDLITGTTFLSPGPSDRVGVLRRR